MEQKPQLPNTTAVLVLGIISVVFSTICCYGVGLVLGIIGVALSVEGRRLYKQNPDMYDGWKNLNAGFTMSIIGICLTAVWLIIGVLYYIIVGTFLFSNLSHTNWN
ncbi:MAG TPA: CCC motif membrane protein [Ferruginibacter sp.]|jgi:hypothetical protein|nr:CCC motif membrane protein [Ferruginibacter sp.]